MPKAPATVAQQAAAHALVDAAYLTLPHPSDLAADSVLMEVVSYDAQFDTFSIITHTAAPCEGQASLVPAVLMPKLTGEYGAPDEFTGRTFLVQPNIAPAVPAAIVAHMQALGWRETPKGDVMRPGSELFKDWTAALKACIEVASEG